MARKLPGKLPVRYRTIAGQSRKIACQFHASYLKRAAPERPAAPRSRRLPTATGARMAITQPEVRHRRRSR
eukprot:3932542-Rhodomonas_salina.2